MSIRSTAPTGPRLAFLVEQRRLASRVHQTALRLVTIQNGRLWVVATREGVDHGGAPYDATLMSTWLMFPRVGKSVSLSERIKDAGTVSCCTRYLSDSRLCLCL